MATLKSVTIRFKESDGSVSEVYTDPHDVLVLPLLQALLGYTSLFALVRLPKDSEPKWHQISALFNNGDYAFFAKVVDPDVVNIGNAKINRR